MGVHGSLPLEGAPEPETEREDTRPEANVADEGAPEEPTEDETLTSALAADQPDVSGDTWPLSSGQEEDVESPDEEEGAPEPETEREDTRPEANVADEGAPEEPTEDETLTSALAADQPDVSGDTWPLSSGQEEDVESPDEEEGAPEPETEREDTRPEANVADEGAPEEPTEDETLTSALAADQPDVSGDTWPLSSGQEEDVESPDEEEGAPEPETEREDTRPEANVADEGAPEEPTEDETLTSALAADQPDVSGDTWPLSSGQEEDVESPDEEEGAPEPETEREDTRPEANVADEGAPEEPTEDETLTSALAADQPDVSGDTWPLSSGQEEDVESPDEEEGAPEPETEREDTRPEANVADEGAPEEPTEDETLTSALAADQPDVSGDTWPLSSGQEEDVESPDEEEGAPEPETEREDTRPEANVADEGAPEEPTEDETLTSALAADQPDVSGDTWPLSSGQEEDVESPDEEEVSTQSESAVEYYTEYLADATEEPAVQEKITFDEGILMFILLFCSFCVIFVVLYKSTLDEILRG
ncbi:trans-Golgi network integral membrane protein 2 [Camelus dromedarius]|uniref:trans-Golgi network integral membrane protein 2 n=1 Tax=Camelus dromedarius TaxID=9838 RepID=UPI0031194D89